MFEALNSPALVVSVAMLAGVFAQVVARHVNVPGVVLLLVGGVLLGPDVTNIVRPQALGQGLSGIVGFAVAVILFEGGLNLNWRVLRTQQTPIQRLVFVGSVLTALGASVAAHLLLGWPWRLTFLFGTLVIVTGPTVITPILRRIHARQSVETILEAEGIFIDAVGATIAVVALEVLLAPAGQRIGTAVFGILLRFGVGTLVGVVGGGAFALLMRFRSALPEGLANVTALACAIAIFQISNAFVPESGITAAILAGMVVGHAGSYDIGELRDFKEQLTVLLVGTLFILLAADVRLSDVRALGWPGLLTVMALMFVVRPINVFVSTFGTELNVREKLFLSWLAPRGIVAAAVSSLFAARMSDAGIAGGVDLRALVFLVIAMTVLLQGMSAGWVAAWLRLRLPREVGFVILGANELARCLGIALASNGEEVVFIDTNADFARAAEEAGFKVVFGDGLDERALTKARVQSRRGCIAATPNESINFLFATKVHDRARGVATFVAIERKESGVSPQMVKQNRSHVLLAGAGELAQWNSGRRQIVNQEWTALRDDTTGGLAFDTLPWAAALPLALKRRGVMAPADRGYQARAGDIVYFAIAPEQADESSAWLQQKGWRKSEPDADEAAAV